MLNRKVSHGHVNGIGRPSEVDRFASFTPSGIDISGRGATDAEALAALASEMRRIATEIDALTAVRH